MKTLITALLLITCSLNIAACNTVSGIGKDLERGGAAIKDAAN